MWLLLPEAAELPGENGCDPEHEFSWGRASWCCFIPAAQGPFGTEASGQCPFFYAAVFPRNGH